MSIDFPALFLRHHGRLDRRAYWIGIAILITVGLISAAVPLVGPLISLALLWPTFCLLAQRLHDAGRGSGLAVAALIPAAISSVFSLLAGLAALMPVAAFAILPLLAVLGMFVGLLGLITLGLIIWIGVMPGDPLINAWGHPLA